MYKIGDFTPLKSVLNKEIKWEARMAILDLLPCEYIASVESDIINYYASLERRERFWVHLDMDVDIDEIKNNMWESWNRNIRLADRIMPTEKTLFIKKMLSKMGIATLLRWLENIPCDMEIIAIINFKFGDNILEFLETVCSSDFSNRVKSILFFLCATDKNVCVDNLYEIVSTHKDSLRKPILDMLCDFNLIQNHRQLSPLYTKLFKVYADNKALNYVSQKTQNKGTLFAWSRILCEFSEKDSNQLDIFQKTYLEWVSSEERYSFSQQSGAEIIKKEFSFINQLSAILEFDDACCQHLQVLWIKKAEYYYGWSSQTTTEYSHWFLHIGLLLWSIGLKRYEDNGDQTLLLAVARNLNEYILSALSSSSYRLLVLQIFQYDYKPTQDLEDCMCDLISKTYDITDLLSIKKQYSKTKFKCISVLTTLRNKIKTVYDFLKPLSISQREIDLAIIDIDKIIHPS